MTKVAIVDDKTAPRQHLASALDDTPGHRCVFACGSVEEALSGIPLHRPDVVLMDTHLRGESGIACAARLRELLPNLQVIMLTVNKDIKTVFEAFQAGACGYLLKRADEREILEAITEARAGGAPMTREIARMVVRSFQNSPVAADPFGERNPLTKRELEILKLVAEGLSNKEIASRTRISFTTVRTHLLHVFKKLNVRCRTEAAAKYLRPSATHAPHPIHGLKH
jgi:DNA-binding NarL/FixJ family response regulator